MTGIISAPPIEKAKDIAGPMIETAMTKDTGLLVDFLVDCI